MSANFTIEGFKRIRQFIQESVKYIDIKDENGKRLFVLDMNDSRVTGLLPDAYEINPMVINVFLLGTDVEIDMGMKIGGADLLEEVDSPALVSVVYSTPFEFQNPEDQLAVRITLNIPNAPIPSTPIP